MGTTYRGFGKVVGRKFETDITYTEFEPDRRIAFAATKPFPTTFMVTLEPVAGGTRVNQTVEAEPGGFFKLAEPLVVTMAKRSSRTISTTSGTSWTRTRS